jgi:hypothetical protein
MNTFTRVTTSLAVLGSCLLLVGGQRSQAAQNSKAVKIVVEFGRDVLVEVAADSLKAGIKKLLTTKWWHKSKNYIDSKKVTVDADDPLRGTLKGEIKVRLLQDKKDLKTVTLRNPAVIRDAENSKQWRLAPKALEEATEKLLKKE